MQTLLSVVVPSAGFNPYWVLVYSEGQNDNTKHSEKGTCGHRCRLCSVGKYHLAYGSLRLSGVSNQSNL